MQDNTIRTLPTDDVVQQQMAQFFDATTDAIFFLDRSFRFTFLNRRAREILAPQGAVLGTVIWESFPDAFYPGSPYVEHYRRSMRDGVPSVFEAYYPAPLERWFSVQSYPADNGIIVFFRDITGHRSAAEALQRNAAELERQHAEIESLYRTAPIGLALFDVPEYRYLRLNERQAAFFGMKPEQIVGRNLTEMAPIPGLRELFDQVARGEPVVNYPLEGTLITDPANYRYWLVSYFPVYSTDGAVQAITAASLEITNQRKAELALMQSEKLAVVGRLASSIAHEINNPLESVTNLLYLARHAEELTIIREYLDVAERELRRAAGITTQTLRFHKQASSPQEVTANELFESVVQIFHGRFANARVVPDVRLRAHSPVRCFEGEIRQVISNLIGNSLDAMQAAPGLLFLRSREGTNWQTGERGVVMTIADTGTGMSSETRARLFDAFYTTKGIMGTGLGLWVSKEIALRHRGKLSLRSSDNPRHHGTVFTLFLPFQAASR